MTGEKKDFAGPLTPDEQKAIRTYDTWVEEDLGCGRGSLLKLFLLAGVAAMVVIAAVLSWHAGLSGEEPVDRNKTAATAVPQDEKPAPEKNKGVKLIYRVPGETDQHILAGIGKVMKRRLEGLGLEEFEMITEESSGEIKILLHRINARQAAAARRILSLSGKILFAIEATEEELQDPVTGLGPKFQLEAFLKAQEKKMQERIRSGQTHTTGEAMELFRKPEYFPDPKAPLVGGAPPRYHYYPPWRWKSKKTGKRMGPRFGAIVHRTADKIFDGGDLDRVFLIEPEPEVEPALAFEIKPGCKNRFRDLTRKHIRRNFCIIINEKLIARPQIMTELPGSGIIQGLGTVEAIKETITLFRSGRLENMPVLVKEEPITSSPR